MLALIGIVLLLFALVCVLGSRKEPDNPYDAYRVPKNWKPNP